MKWQKFMVALENERRAWEEKEVFEEIRKAELRPSPERVLLCFFWKSRVPSLDLAEIARM